MMRVGGGPPASISASTLCMTMNRIVGLLPWATNEAGRDRQRRPKKSPAAAIRRKRPWSRDFFRRSVPSSAPMTTTPRIAAIAALGLCLGRMPLADAAPEKTTAADVKAMLRNISAQRIEATIRKLVSFGTRHTLSDAKSEERGIGAARRWIKSEFERYSKENGGGGGGE